MATQDVKKARITAIVFGVLSGLSLIAFVYAFMQQAEAERQKSLATELFKRNQEHEENQFKMTQLMQKQNVELERIASEMRDALNEAREELKKYKGK